MATTKKTAEVDYSMYEKIMALYELQKIDSQIDEINKVKGELPDEVQDLDDEIAGLKTRVEGINAEIEELGALTRQRRRQIDEANMLIAKYNEQQANVRNNREFDAIAKEIEYQELEIRLAEKHLREYATGVKAKKAKAEQTEALIAERNVDLEAKRTELENIESETADQVAELMAQAEKMAAGIAKNAPIAVRNCKKAINEGLDVDMDAAIVIEEKLFGDCFETEDQKYGMAFFLDKNKEKVKEPFKNC